MHERGAPAGSQAVRLFRSDFLEWFSRTGPAVVAAFWVPSAVALLVAGTALGRPGPGRAALIAVAALALWSLFEYAFHRFLFHGAMYLPGGKRLAFLLHGCHHADPMDAGRNVMPLVVTIPVFLAFFWTFSTFVALPDLLMLFGFFAFTYLAYDLTHYACHQRAMRGPIARYLKRHHLLHHYADSARNFGVTSPAWDWIFGSLRKT